jgi:hypothetical protein
MTNLKIKKNSNFYDTVPLTVKDFEVQLLAEKVLRNVA